MNKVSVITVCINNAQGLEKTLSSVFAQTYKNIEQIVIDGGSTDSTHSVIEKYKDRISYSVSEHDGGVYDAMNKGIGFASGEWLIMMNAGDIFAADNVIEYLIEIAVKNPSKKVLYSNYWENDKKGRKNQRVTNRSKLDVHHQSFFYKRNLHEQYGYYVQTKPYTVSDLLFMLSIPEEQYLKVPFEIASIEIGGISSSDWCAEKALAVRVAYGQLSLFGALLRYIKYKILRML